MKACAVLNSGVGRVFVASLFLALLSACSLSPQRQEKVDARVDQLIVRDVDCAPADRASCSEPSPLRELAESDVRTGLHHVTLVEIGEDALKLRLHMIRSARDHINLQNFILRRDETGGLVLDELVEAARRGVKVRVLLDQMFSVSDLDFLAGLTMAHTNFEIRFFNPSFDKAKMAKRDWISGVACCFNRFNRRMHNKLMEVDELMGVVGGRNVADRYFDYDTDYEFKDRDVLVYGTTARQMRSSFNDFWDGKRSVPVQHLRDVARELLDGVTPEEPGKPSERLKPLLAEVADPERMRVLFVEPAFEVDRLAYFSDLPRKSTPTAAAAERDITLVLHGLLLSAERSVVIQSPYMVLSKEAREVFRELRVKNPGIELIFSTNSLASTDADMVYANTHKHKKRYVKKLGFRMYEFKPFPVDAPYFFPRWPKLIEEKKLGIESQSPVAGNDSTIPIPAPRVGMHSKSFVIDSKVAMIGSHNFDPRSESYNTENGVIIWDADFAKHLEEIIRIDIEPQNSWVVAMKPDRKTAEALKHSGEVQRKTRYDSRFYGSASVFELIPGKEVVTPDSPDFYKNYYSVGNFPEVIQTRRQVNVLLMGSFIGLLEPIL